MRALLLAGVSALMLTLPGVTMAQQSERQRGHGNRTAVDKESGRSSSTVRPITIQEQAQAVAPPR